jgi:hypothetical protein
MNCHVLTEIILIYFLTLQPWISCSARCSIGQNYTARCLACHYFCDLSQTSRDCCPRVSRGTIGGQLSIECLIHILVSHFPARSCLGTPRGEHMPPCRPSSRENMQVLEQRLVPTLRNSRSPTTHARLERM